MEVGLLSREYSTCFEVLKCEWRQNLMSNPIIIIIYIYTMNFIQLKTDRLTYLFFQGLLAAPAVSPQPSY